ncbi:hypothetical protein DSO57_1010352 [Entomophthora muscae]|uniref:Uncharacterized protein n=1 Tax=Entomophthora muscae TaxID=34485 RepID=A0ACC2UGB9_9FUNG|nr:hypothetical protein DSO57_1010352 [Entomophthora muscae]
MGVSECDGVDLFFNDEAVLLVAVDVCGGYVDDALELLALVGQLENVNGSHGVDVECIPEGEVELDGCGAVDDGLDCVAKGGFGKVFTDAEAGGGKVTLQGRYLVGEFGVDLAQGVEYGVGKGVLQANLGRLALGGADQAVHVLNGVVVVAEYTLQDRHADESRCSGKHDGLTGHLDCV